MKSADKIIFVTDGANGIGKALCERLNIENTIRTEKQNLL